MKCHRCVWALLAAVVLISALGVSDANAFGSRRTYAAPGYYPHPGYDYPYYSAYGFPWVMPLPGYGILPLPLSAGNYGTGANRYGYDYPYGGRGAGDDSGRP